MITAIDKNTALVLIDLQKGITKMKTAHAMSGVIEKSALLASAFRKAGLPVVVVNVALTHANPRALKTRKDKSRIPQSKIGLALAKFMMSVTGFTEIIKEVGAQSGDIFITKGTPNAFYNTPLHTELQKRGVTGIVLAGVSTSAGVEGTARAAAERGYNISFATDAMTDRILEAHENSTRIIFPRIGELGTASEIIEKLNNRT